MTSRRAVQTSIRKKIKKIVNQDSYKLKIYYNSIKDDLHIVDQWKRYLINYERAFNSKNGGDKLHYQNQKIINKLVQDKDLKQLIYSNMKMFSNLIFDK